MDGKTAGGDGAGDRFAPVRTDGAPVVAQAHPAPAPRVTTESADELDRLIDRALAGTTDARPGRADALLALAGAGLVVGGSTGFLTGPWPAIGVVLLVLAAALPAMHAVRAVADRRRLRRGTRVEEPPHAER